MSRRLVAACVVMLGVFGVSVVARAQPKALTLEEHAAAFTSKDRWNPKTYPGRLAAREAFLAAGDKSVPMLERVAMTEDANPFHRADALVLLGQIDGSAAVKALRTYLLEGKDYVYYQNHAMTLSGKRLAVRVLVQMKPAEARAFLVSTLKGEGNVPVAVRVHVAEAFGDLGLREYAPDIARLLDVKDVQSRRIVAEALARLADERTVSAVRKLAEKPGEYQTRLVRQNAAIALGRIPTESAAEALSDFVDDRTGNVAVQAIRALARHAKSKRAEAILRTRLERATGSRLIERVRALAHMGHRDGTGALLVKDLATQTKLNTRLRAIEVMGEVGGAEASKALIGLLVSKEPDERYVAALALGRLKATDATDALRKLTKDADANVRDAAVEALARIGGTHVEPPTAGVQLAENGFVVYYGDSITGETIYRAQITRAIREAHPYETRWFQTRGQHGWSLTDVFKAPRDALVEWPDIITTQYGMNDVGYASSPDYKQGTAKYRKRYAHLLNVLEEYRRSPARRVLITATGGNPNLPVTAGYWGNVGETMSMKRSGGKAEILRREACASIDLAGKMNVEVADVNSPMRVRTRECMARGDSLYVLGDGWHPSGYGGKVMALEVLKVLGHFANVEGHVSVSAGTGRASDVFGLRLPDLDCSKKHVRFTVDTPDRPLLRRASDFEVFGAVRSTGSLRQGIATLNLKVTGLVPGRYKVLVDGADARQFSHVALDKGVRVHLDRDRSVELLAREQIEYLEQARERAAPLGAKTASLVRAIDGSLAKLKLALRHTVEVVGVDTIAKREPVDASTFSDVYVVLKELHKLKGAVDDVKYREIAWPIEHVFAGYYTLRVAPEYKGLEYPGPEINVPVTLFFGNIFHAPLSGTPEVIAPDGWEVELDAKPFNNLAREGHFHLKGSIKGKADRGKLVQIVWAKVKVRTAGVEFEHRHPLVVRSGSVEVAGPFAARSVPPRMKVIPKDAPGRPADEPELAAATAGPAQALKWKQVTSRAFQPRYVLAPAVGYGKENKASVDGHVVVVRVAFRCPQERDCFLEVNAQGARAHQVFLNGRDLGYQRGFGRLRVHLKKGTNALISRVFPEDKDGGSGLAYGFEFSDVDSTPFDDLTVVTDRP